MLYHPSRYIFNNNISDAMLELTQNPGDCTYLRDSNDGGKLYPEYTLEVIAAQGQVYRR